MGHWRCLLGVEHRHHGGISRLSPGRARIAFCLLVVVFVLLPELFDDSFDL